MDKEKIDFQFDREKHKYLKLSSLKLLQQKQYFEQQWHRAIVHIAGLIKSGKSTKSNSILRAQDKVFTEGKLPTTSVDTCFIYDQNLKIDEYKIVQAYQNDVLADDCFKFLKQNSSEIIKGNQIQETMKQTHLFLRKGGFQKQDKKIIVILRSGNLIFSKMNLTKSIILIDKIGADDKVSDQKSDYQLNEFPQNAFVVFCLNQNDILSKDKEKIIARFLTLKSSNKMIFSFCWRDFFSLNNIHDQEKHHEFLNLVFREIPSIFYQIIKKLNSNQMELFTTDFKLIENLKQMFNLLSFYIQLLNQIFEKIQQVKQDKEKFDIFKLIKKKKQSIQDKQKQRKELQEKYQRLLKHYPFKYFNFFGLQSQNLNKQLSQNKSSQKIVKKVFQLSQKFFIEKISVESNKIMENNCQNIQRKICKIQQQISNKEIFYKLPLQQKKSINEVKIQMKKDHLQFQKIIVEQQKNLALKMSKQFNFIQEQCGKIQKQYDQKNPSKGFIKNQIVQVGIKNKIEGTIASSCKRMLQMQSQFINGLTKKIKSHFTSKPYNMPQEYFTSGRLGIFKSKFVVFNIIKNYIELILNRVIEISEKIQSMWNSFINRNVISIERNQIQISIGFQMNLSSNIRHLTVTLSGGFYIAAMFTDELIIAALGASIAYIAIPITIAVTTVASVYQVLKIKEANQEASKLNIQYYNSNKWNNTKNIIIAIIQNGNKTKIKLLSYLNTQVEKSNQIFNSYLLNEQIFQQKSIKKQDQQNVQELKQSLKRLKLKIYYRKQRYLNRQTLSNN